MKFTINENVVNFFGKNVYDCICMSECILEKLNSITNDEGETAWVSA